MSSRSLALGALIAASSLTVDVAGAQQRPASRFVPTPIVAAPVDSAALYRHDAHVQRRNGSALLLVGLGAITAAYVQLAHSGQRGMNGAQATTFVAGTVVGIAGVSRWAASSENLQRAEAYRTDSVVVVKR